MNAMPELDAPAQLREAYLALGSAIADLRSTPMRRYSHDEEAMRLTSAQRSIGEAQVKVELASEALGTPSPAFEVEPRGFGTGRALARPVVWEWIADLQAARAQIARTMEAQGIAVPDDLPEGSALERLGGTPGFRHATTIAFGLLLVGGIIALVMSLTAG